MNGEENGETQDRFDTNRQRSESDISQLSPSNGTMCPWYNMAERNLSYLTASSFSPSFVLFFEIVIQLPHLSPSFYKDAYPYLEKNVFR